MKTMTTRPPALLLSLFCAAAVILAACLEARAAKETYTLTYTHSYKVNKLPPRTRAGEDLYELIYENYDYTNMYGQPVRKVFFRIPVDAQNPTVTVTYKNLSDTRTLDGELAEQEMMTTNGEPVYDADMDSIGVVRPGMAEACIAEIASDSFVGRTMRIVSISISPTEYDPETRKLKLYDNVKVELDYSSKTNLSDWSPKSTLEAVMNNYTNNSARFNDPLFPLSKYYYIIVPDSMAHACQRLANWKRQKGYTVMVKTVEDIYNEYPIDPSNGIEDKAESIRSYLAQQHYNIQRNNVVFIKDMYVLLVGDYSTGFPTRRILTEDGICGYYYNKNNLTEDDIFRQNFTPTDNYFSDVTSDLHLVKVSGKPKLISDSIAYVSSVTKYSPSIPVGRILCGSCIEVENYTDKLICYESYPGEGDVDYLANAFAFQYCEPNYSKTSEDVFESITFISNENKYIIKENVCQEEGPGIHETPALPTGTQVIEEMNNGYGYMSWHGHGQPGSITTSANKIVMLDDNLAPVRMDSFYSYRGIKSLCEYDKTKTGIDPEPSNKDGLDALHNFKKPWVVYSMACDILSYGPIWDKSNTFQYEDVVNMGRSYTSWGNYGGVAFLGNARNGYWRTSPELEKHFLDALTKCPKLGIAEAVSKFTCNDDKIITTTHHLIGDPEFEIWLSVPKSMSATIRRSSVGVTYDSNYLLST